MAWALLFVSDRNLPRISVDTFLCSKLARKYCIKYLWQLVWTLPNHSKSQSIHNYCSCKLICMNVTEFISYYGLVTASNRIRSFVWSKLDNRGVLSTKNPCFSWWDQGKGYWNISEAQFKLLCLLLQFQRF